MRIGIGAVGFVACLVLAACVASQATVTQTATPEYTAPPLGGEPYFAPTWPCSTGGAWALDKDTIEWVCVDKSYQVVERVDNPTLRAKIALAQSMGSMTYHDCTAAFEGFVGGLGPGPCHLPDDPIIVDVH